MAQKSAKKELRFRSGATCGFSFVVTLRVFLRVFQLNFLPPQESTSLIFNSTRIEDKHENQLRLIWLPFTRQTRKPSRLFYLFIYLFTLRLIVFLLFVFFFCQWLFSVHYKSCVMSEVWSVFNDARSHQGNMFRSLK